MVEWIRNTMNALGYPGVAVLMFLENVFPPIPSELVMPLAGFTATQGKLTFAGVVTAGMLGSAAGALVLYYLGKLVGAERLMVWADRYGKWLGVSGKDIVQSQGWFERHGGQAVFFCRLVPGVRSLISIPAGLANMHLAPFLLYSALGSGLWAGLLAYGGYVLGENYERLNTYLGPASYVVLGAVLLLAVGFIWRRNRQTAVGGE